MGMLLKASVRWIKAGAVMLLLLLSTMADLVYDANWDGDFMGDIEVNVTIVGGMPRLEAVMLTAVVASCFPLGYALLQVGETAFFMISTLKSSSINQRQPRPGCVVTG